MSHPNPFNNNVFNLTQLTAAINKLPFAPMRLNDLGLFSSEGVATLSVYIEEQNGALSLVPISSRGSAGEVAQRDSRRVVGPFGIPHLGAQASIFADEVMGIRAFGSESQQEAINTLRDQRLIKMRRQLEYTMESHRIEVLKGSFYTVNGVKASLFTTFGKTQKEVSFALATATTELRSKCLEVLVAVEDALGGAGMTGMHAFCGANFWSQIITHKAIKETFLNQTQAADLRGDPRQLLNFGGIVFERYHGTAECKIPDDEAVAFPLGVPDLFISRFAPADYMETVGTLGIPYYVKSELMPMNKGILLEAQSNPLNLCTRPECLIKLTVA